MEKKPIGVGVQAELSLKGTVDWGSSYLHMPGTSCESMKFWKVVFLKAKFSVDGWPERFIRFSGVEMSTSLNHNYPSFGPPPSCQIVMPFFCHREDTLSKHSWQFFSSLWSFFGDNFLIFYVSICWRQLSIS